MTKFVQPEAAAACRKALLESVSDGGGTQVWSLQHGFSREYIRQVLKGNREPAGRLLTVLGWERVISYRKIEEPLP